VLDVPATLPPTARDAPDLSACVLLAKGADPEGWDCPMTGARSSGGRARMRRAVAGIRRAL